MLLLTLDIDWVPDFVLEHAADHLRAAGVRATWFVTHQSQAVRRLGLQPELFELGLHPNFHPGSSHGSSAEEVLDHCLQLTPGARSARMHDLFQSTRHLRLLARTSVRADLSLVLHRQPHLAAFRYPVVGPGFVRVPTFFEDDLEMVEPRSDWRLEPLLATPGLKVFDFHPIHVYLNCPTFETYLELRELGPIQSLRPEQVEPLRRSGPGPGRLFEELIAHLAGGPSLQVCQFVEGLPA